MSEEDDPPGSPPLRYRVGHGRAPKQTRFKKGHSGNPKGRPRGKKTPPAYERVLGQRVTIREHGKSRRVRADEAFLLHMVNKAVAGCVPAGQRTLRAVEEVKARNQTTRAPLKPIVFVGVSPECANLELRALRMAKWVDRFRPTGRILIEPWLVEAALARLGDRRLTTEEQEIVWRATRTPHKVPWPGWWSVR